jgi:transposase InsO family protein
MKSIWPARSGAAEISVMNCVQGAITIVALYVKPRLSIPNTSHRKYPYLLRDLVIDRPNQVWAADITYIPMAKGFCYLVAVMDWATRMVLAWRLSNTLDSAFCIDALQEAIDRYGCPEIVPITSPSAWTAKAAGRTMYLSNGSGEASNTRMAISSPMPLPQSSEQD